MKNIESKKGKFYSWVFNATSNRGWVIEDGWVNATSTECFLALGLIRRTRFLEKNVGGGKMHLAYKVAPYSRENFPF
jgi:hypothetical protein